MRRVLGILAAAAVGTMVGAGYAAISGEAKTQDGLYILMAVGAAIGVIVAILVRWLISHRRRH